jgi:DNA modification methylase
MINLYNDDCLEVMDKLIATGVKVDAIITSPPYWGLRDYKIKDTLGEEVNPKDYVDNLVNIYFDKCYKLLKNDGVMFVNIGDSYFRNGGVSKGRNEKANVGNTIKGIQKGNCKVPTGYKEKSLALIPQRFAVSMSDYGWIVRNNIIWHKPNAMPQPVKDRFVVDFENVFMFSKHKKYMFNILKENITGKDRLKRTTWSINTKPSKYGHIAPFPESLVIPMVESSTNKNDTILDPFMGSGTTGVSCKNLNRSFIGIELDDNYFKIAKERIDAPVIGDWFE